MEFINFDSLGHRHENRIGSVRKEPSEILNTRHSTSRVGVVFDDSSTLLLGYDKDSIPMRIHNNGRD